MQVNIDVLEKLLCSLCNEYLSCGPVFILENGNSVCGRCTVPKQQASVRNMPYEDLAKQMKFPCKNHKQGCPVKLLFHQLKSHEHGCKYRTCNCLIAEADACKWTGLVCDFLKHCQQVHSDAVVENPVTLEHDFTKTSNRTMVIAAFEALFIIYMKVCLTSGKIHHSVHNLLNAVQNATFNYELLISNSNGEIRRGGKVIPTGSQENCSLLICIPSLCSMLGKVIGTSFKIEVKFMNLTCLTCKKQIEYDLARQLENAWYCRPCFPDIQTCKYKDAGCKFEDTYNKLVKHEMYYCIASKGACCLCTETFSTSTIWHYREKHTNSICDTESDTFNITTEIGKINVLFASDVGLLHCNVTITNSEVNFKVVTPLKSNELSTYTCVLNLKKFHSTLDDEIDMTYSANDQTFDWSITLNKQTFTYKYVTYSTTLFTFNIILSNKTLAK